MVRPGVDEPLAALQREMVDAIRRRSPVSRNPELAPRFDDLVVRRGDALDGAQRIDIYREQFWLRHVPSLAEDYPTLLWALGGREAFEDLAVEYLGAHPPRTWDLQKLGADLPAYLAARSRWAGDALARDAAVLDWAFMEAFDAPDAAPFDAAALAAAPEDAWSGAVVVFHPSLRAEPLGYPLHEVRAALERGESPARPAAGRCRVVVWRDAACVRRAAAVEPLAFDLLSALRRGVPLGEACAALAAADGSPGAEVLESLVAEWFRRWTAGGWVSDVRFERAT